VIPKAGDDLVVVAAAHEESARRAANEFGCEHAVGWERTVSRNDIDAVIVCTPPSMHAAISIAALNAGKHVLCEKPLARSSVEASKMLVSAEKNARALKCGFNHRYHPSLKGIKTMIDQGALGDVFYVRANYGIGTRAGYEKEWRVDSRSVSGGQLMEQGIHLVDLARWYLGEFSEVFAMTSNFFIKTEPFEDNAFVTLRTREGRVAFLHASLTEWKNTFGLEIYGSEGYAVSTGLRGSYGAETLSYGRREPGKPFSEQITEFRGEDTCWVDEWLDFRAEASTALNLDSALDGLKAIQVVEKAYESARTSRVSNISLE
jgi:predicted dehydrogenase